MIYALLSQKGGVGKTTLSIHLADALARRGARVLLIDADPQQSAMKRFGALVPVGDDAALAAAIVATLDNPPRRERLVERGMEFTAERSVEQYARFIPSSGRGRVDDWRGGVAGRQRGSW